MAAAMKRNDSHHANTTKQKTDGTTSQHHLDWPNAAGFNALGDQRERLQLKISGTIPSYVAGELYRTGPGGYKITRDKPKDGVFKASHWFDGFTTTHKFDLVKGTGDNGACSEVWYRSYCQTDELIEHVRKTGRLDAAGFTFGQKRDPCDSFYKKVKTAFTPAATGTLGPHIANIGVTFRQTLPAELEKTIKDAGVSNIEGRRVLTLATDAQSAKHFNADTLEPLGVATQQDLHLSLSGPLSAAHAAHDPETGDIFNYNLAFGAKQVYRVFRASPSGEVEILAEISGADIRGAYIHSMHITPNFLVLCIWPAFYAAKGLGLVWQRNILDALAPFDPNAQATWCVIDRRHGRGLVKKFKSPAFFCFHTTNAWEETREDDPDTVDLVCEQVEFNNMNLLHGFYYDALVSDEAKAGSPETLRNLQEMEISLVRHKLADVPLHRSAATATTSRSSSSTLSPTQEVLRISNPHAGDLPRYNPHYQFRPHRYVWCILIRGKSSFTDGLGKMDAQTGTSVVWERARHTPGEPIFCPAPNARTEDEGVVLSVVLDGDTGTSYLLCLDAHTMEEVGSADVTRAVGFGFHGMHVPSSA